MANPLSFIGDLLGGIAPTIATALGGPLAGAAVDTLADALDIKELKASPGKPTSQALSKVREKLHDLTPEQAVALRKCDADFETKLRELDIEEIALRYQDLRDARSAGRVNRTPDILAGAYTIAYFGVFALVLFKQLPAGSENLIHTLLGVLTAAQASIMTYYFGSSAGSKAKTDALVNGQK